MSVWGAILAWAGIVLLLVVAVAVLVLLQRVFRPLREIERYSDEILESGLGIARNLDGAGEILETRDLAQALGGAVAR